VSCSESKFHIIAVELQLLTSHRELDEKTRLQREREAAAEAKIAARRAGLSSGLGERVPSRDISGNLRGPATAEGSSVSERPRIALAPRAGGDSAPSWREREAARKAAGGQAETTVPSRPAPSSERTRDASEEPPRRPGGYVPPARRGEGAPTEGSGYVPPARRAPAEGGAEGRAGAYVAPLRRAAPEADSGSGAEGRTGYVPPARRAAGEAEGGGWRSREAARRDGPPGPRDDSTNEGGRQALRAPAFGGRGTSAASGRDESPLPPPSGGTDGKYKPGMFRKTRDGGA
jgi:translation initiation factor 3 subunit A